MTSISSEAAFAIWAPDDVLWSEWAKPVAFVQPGMTIQGEPIPDSALPQLPSAIDGRSAIVVDLPAAEAVYAGLALAGRGFRPVPLFNGTSGPSAIIDVHSITRALGSGAERLPPMTIAPDAAPAFLLDSRRSSPASSVRPGVYDNRWIVLPQDFPSSAMLASRGIRVATLIQRDGLSIRPDLAHVLRRWQDAGIEVRVIDLASGQIAANVDVPKPSHFKLAWYAAIALFGLRRSNVGGFGSMIPEQTSRSGFYG
jgi:hypothetical protein